MTRSLCDWLSRLLFVAAQVALLSGCGAMQIAELDRFQLKSPQDDRRDKALRDFERQRNDAQIRAAVSQWRRGNFASCQKQLVQLLERTPDDIESRRLLADLCLELNDLDQHEHHLRLLLKHRPDDAQAHHSLALALQEAGRQKESAEHFRRALELEPENRLYALNSPPVSQP